jgi:hypothetical protein
MTETVRVSRPVAIVVAAVGLVVAAFGLIIGRAQTTVHYLLPSPTGVTSHTASFGPGVFASWVAALVLVLTAIWLVLAALGRSTVAVMVVMIGLLVADVVVLLVVSGLQRPSF